MNKRLTAREISAAEAATEVIEVLDERIEITRAEIHNLCRKTLQLSSSIGPNETVSGKKHPTINEVIKAIQQQLPQLKITEPKITASPSNEQNWRLITPGINDCDAKGINFEGPFSLLLN